MVGIQPTRPHRASIRSRPRCFDSRSTPSLVGEKIDEDSRRLQDGVHGYRGEPRHATALALGRLHRGGGAKASVNSSYTAGTCRCIRGQAFDNILEELRKMDARDDQFDTGAEHQPRNPNKPYANSSFDDPGVVARFERDGQQSPSRTEKGQRELDDGHFILSQEDRNYHEIPIFGSVSNIEPTEQ